MCRLRIFCSTVLWNLPRFDVYPAHANGRQLSSTATLILQEDKQHNQLRMIGNGMHIPTIAMWTLYCMSNMELRSSFFKLSKSVAGSGMFEDPDDEDHP